MIGDAVHPSAFFPVASDFAYMAEVKGRAAAAPGLGGATAVIPGVPGGLPSSIYSSERTGDLLELDIPARIGAPAARGEGPTYQPHPALPTAQSLDYVSKFSSATLFSLGLLLLLIYFARNPTRAARGVARGSLKRAGVEE